MFGAEVEILKFTQTEKISLIFFFFTRTERNKKLKVCPTQSRRIELGSVWVTLERFQFVLLCNSYFHTRVVYSRVDPYKSGDSKMCRSK